MEKQTIIDEHIPVIASFSGGKDSTAMALFLLYESGIPKEQVHFVFADTGWEHHYTYWQVLKLAELHPVQIVKSKKYNGIPGLMRDRGIPMQKARFCTQELKIFPIRDYLAMFDKYVQVKGIRHEEGRASNERGTVEEFELDLGTMMYSWYPIREYTLQDVWDIHTNYNFPRNKLYDLGFSRVGCAPCIFARKDEIAMWSDIVPEHFDTIREAEKQRNFPYFSPTGKPKQYVTNVSNNGKPYAPIDNVILWAKTDRKDHKHFKPDTGKEPSNPDEDIQGTCLEGLCE